MRLVETKKAPSAIQFQFAKPYRYAPFGSTGRRLPFTANVSERVFVCTKVDDLRTSADHRPRGVDGSARPRRCMPPIAICYGQERQNV